MEYSIKLLGQSGCRIDLSQTVIYMDPYLSNSVQELDSADLERMIPIPIRPEDVDDADFVLISHEHIDHCDPKTLPYLAQASPECRFFGPQPVIDTLVGWGIDKRRCMLAQEKWETLVGNIRVMTVPAAHPRITRDDQGNLSAVGFVIEVENKRLYLAGDTSIEEEILRRLHDLKPISLALLPVNEHNYYRGRRNIIGNMSVRDAFGLAEEIGVSSVVPVHWDMFKANSVSPDEISAIFSELKPSFELQLSNKVIKF